MKNKTQELIETLKNNLELLIRIPLMMVNRHIWFIKSDIEIKYETCWYGKDEKIDGFRFYSKIPFSRSYQLSGTIGLEYTYQILSLIQKTIKERKKALIIEISHGCGVYERIYIWKDSLKKAEQQISKMIKELQKQY